MNADLGPNLTSDPIGCALPPWTREEAQTIYDLPFNDLLFRAQTIHRENFDPNRVQLSRLLSIKTGGCPEGLRLEYAHVRARSDAKARGGG